MAAAMFAKLGPALKGVGKDMMKKSQTAITDQVKEKSQELMEEGQDAIKNKLQNTMTTTDIKNENENTPKTTMSMTDAKQYASSILSKKKDTTKSNTSTDNKPANVNVHLKKASKGGGFVGIAIVTAIGLLALLANLIVFIIFKAIFNLKSPYRTKKPQQDGEGSDNNINLEVDDILAEAEGMEDTSEIPELDEGGSRSGTMHKGFVILYWLFQLLLSSLFVGIFYQLLAKTKLSEYIPPMFTLAELFYPFIIFQMGWFILTLFGIISDVLSEITSIPAIVKHILPELMNIVPIKLFFISEPPDIKLNRVSKPKFFAIHLYFFLFPIGMILLGWAFVALRVVKGGL
jgi:hypothetical protein